MSGEDMGSIIEYKVDEKYIGKKIRDYLRGSAELSTRLIRGASKDGRVKVNYRVVKMDYILKKDDVIQVELSKDESQDIEPQPMDIDVVFENNDLLVVNKPPHMVVHPTRSYPCGTLANGILYYFKEKGENCIVRLVSRLDMDTSGLIIIAKNQFAHAALAREMQYDSFEKSYLAIVHGEMKEEKGTIDLPIYKPGDDSIKRIVDERGQRSVTHYQVIEHLNGGNLVKLTLETGRTHQIRVHLSHLGNPIFGDTLYGTSEDGDYIKRQALHAYKLSFPDPRSGELIVLESKMPEDMLRLKQKLE